MIDLRTIYNHIEAACINEIQPDSPAPVSYLLCERTIQVNYPSPNLYQALHPALAHLEVDPIAPPDLLIRVMEKEPTRLWEQDIWFGTHPEEPASNYISADKNIFMQRTEEGALSIVDRSLDCACFWVRNLESLPYWEMAAPLRIIINWWGIANGMQLLHAAAIGCPGRGVLLAGKSGSGKSTTAVSCLAAGLLYLGDDHVILDTNKRTEVHNIFSTAKLNDDMAPLFNVLGTSLHRMPHRCSEKQMAILPREMITSSLPLVALLIPSISGERTSRIEPASAMQGMLALAPSTLLYCPGGAEQTLNTLAELSRTLPVYRLFLGTDHDKLAAFLTEWISSLNFPEEAECHE